MDQIDSKPQEHVGGSPADSCNDPPADEVLTVERDVSPPQVTDTSDSSEKKQSDDHSVIVDTGTSSSNTGSEIENENEEKANGKEKHSEKEDKGSSMNIEGKKSPEDLLKEIQMRNTHDLYCPHCTHSITETAIFFRKEEETFPYNKEKFLLWVVIVISFKYPFIYIPWLYNPTPGPEDTLNASDSVTKNEIPPSSKLERPGVGELFSKHIVTPLQNLLLNIVKTVEVPVLDITPTPTSSSPNLQEVPVLTTPPKPNPDPQGPQEITPSKPIPVSPEPVPSSPWLIRSSLRFLLVLVLLLLSVIVLWFPQHVVEVGKLFPSFWPTPFGPSPPPPPPTNLVPVPPNDPANVEEDDGHITPSTLLEKTGGLIRSLSVIPLLLLAILARRWLTMSWIPFPKPPILVDLWGYIVVSVQETDILKSIVYGGLIQSMTSLSIVSSAAAAGASFLNVLALGAANLFTGFFLICHNLHGLIYYKRGSQSAHNENTTPFVVAEEDPYTILLGNVNNKPRHVLVVLLSFAFFGVIPPYLFYDLSIKGTDRGYYNAALVLSGTLVCVISLSWAKAYAFKLPKKLRTVLEYTAMAIVASALSFVATDQFRKNGFHELACV